MHTLNNENSSEHWKFINVQNKIVLDLGCGRWNKVERVEDHWLTTPEHFINMGAKKVIGLDIDPIEIEWFKKRFDNNIKYEFILRGITSSQDIDYLYNKYRPDCVKFDIETAEKFLLDLDVSVIRLIEEYYIETHGKDLYEKFIHNLPKYGFIIHEQIDLIHTNNYCKVIFAKRI